MSYRDEQLTEMRAALFEQEAKSLREQDAAKKQRESYEIYLRGAIPDAAPTSTAALPAVASAGGSGTGKLIAVGFGLMIAFVAGKLWTQAEIVNEDRGSLVVERKADEPPDYDYHPVSRRSRARDYASSVMDLYEGERR
jgi:hypothetical protein